MSIVNYLKKIAKIYLLKYKPLKIEKIKWEKQFKEGHWNYLNNMIQLSRYSLIIGYFNTFFPDGGRVLDVGCGQGVLYNSFKKTNSIKYVGIDISETAIKFAQSTSLNKDVFICVDLTKFNPDKSFDFIVFNESLYYLDNPIEVLQKYSYFLNSGGKIIVSMWDNKERNNKLWGLIEKNFNIIDGVYLKNLQAQFGWILKIFEKKIL